MAELPWLPLCSAKQVVASCSCAFWHAPTLRIHIGEKQAVQFAQLIVRPYLLIEIDYSRGAFPKTLCIKLFISMKHSTTKIVLKIK